MSVSPRDRATGFQMEAHTPRDRATGSGSATVSATRRDRATGTRTGPWSPIRPAPPWPGSQHRRHPQMPSAANRRPPTRSARRPGSRRVSGPRSCLRPGNASPRAAQRACVTGVSVDHRLWSWVELQSATYGKRPQRDAVPVTASASIGSAPVEASASISRRQGQQGERYTNAMLPI